MYWCTDISYLIVYVYGPLCACVYLFHCMLINIVFMYGVRYVCVYCWHCGISGGVERHGDYQSLCVCVCS